ncbi:hypothetical protein HMPREF9630_00054 [Peptoanaerobacter stomatis]|uniref:DNA polymerase III, delta' subunit n=1 Tax=Peptoanaerobacter stomatis TaxID=796937 RepID=V9HSA2_9FIRM|nr:DNA-directed DNA polymerase III subunit delta' [Peptoanaerobacter stomatis]EHL18329.1 hypothetical protein HMPREF9630_00054 [Peptoanaerobacter stomatis]
MSKYEQIRDLLFDEHEQNTLRHAYIFESSDLSLALKLSTQLCNKILETSNLSMISDYHLIKKEDMNVQTIRDITKDSIVQPFKAKKIYVFEDSMKFTIPMQNAFLKTLEEPPPDVIFILLTENANSLLETIRSRCIIYFFDEEVSELSQREDINIKTRQLFDILIAKDKIKMIQYMEDLKKSKDDIDDILTYILDNSRNIMIAKESIALLPDKHKQNKYIHDIINKFTYYQLLTIIDIVEDTRKKLNRNCSFSMTIELMLMNIMEVMN